MFLQVLKGSKSYTIRLGILLIASTVFVNWYSFSRMTSSTQQSSNQIDLSPCNCHRTTIQSPPPSQISTDGEEFSFIDTTCSFSAFARGAGQKVLSYVFYVNPNRTEAADMYFEGIVENLKTMQHFYPGWIMRLYVDCPLDSEWLKKLCDIACTYDYLDLCFVRDLPGNPTRDVSLLFPMLWRFLPTLDPQVDVFASRDLDCRFSERELAAMNVWLHNSSMPIVAMLDHPRHAFPILGGAWGSHSLRQNARELWRSTWPSILNHTLAWKDSSERRGPDQKILRSVVWETWAVNLTLQFNAYRCDSFNASWASRPWPSKRPMPGPNNFVGANVSKNRSLEVKCPAECRPREHQDWEYC